MPYAAIAPSVALTNTSSRTPPHAEQRTGGDGQHKRRSHRHGGGDVHQREQNRTPRPELSDPDQQGEEPGHHTSGIRVVVGRFVGRAGLFLHNTIRQNIGALGVRHERRGGLDGWSAALLRAPAALGEHVRQTFERFGGLLKTGRDLIRVGPRGGIEALGERKEHLLASRIRNTLRDSLPDDRIPAHEKRDLLVRRSPPRSSTESRVVARVAAVAPDAVRPAPRPTGACADDAARLTLRRPAGCGTPRSSRTRSRDAALRSACRTSGSSASRPTRTPPGVRNTYRIRDC